MLNTHSIYNQHVEAARRFELGYSDGDGNDLGAARWFPRRGKRRLSNNGVVVIAAADSVCCSAVAIRWKLGALYVPDKWRLGGLGCSSARTVPSCKVRLGRWWDWFYKPRYASMSMICDAIATRVHICAYPLFFCITRIVLAPGDTDTLDEERDHVVPKVECTQSSKTLGNQ